MISQLRIGDRRCNLVIKAGPSDVDFQTIRDLPVRIPSGGWVPLNSLVTIQVTSGPSTIYRENMQRAARISCGVKDRDRSDVVTDIRKALGPLVDDLEDRHSIEIGAR